ncbi:MAG: cysteine--tRNA ligase, partial [Planctomycetes bacterium]|nr:cysteine--tRNA ligase [Planctomycetota bacterium]
VFEFVAVVNKANPTATAAEDALRAFARFEDVLAVFGDEPKADDTGDAPPELVALLGERKQAKAAKDWARADEIRDRIQAAGYKIVDTPAGARLEKA